MRGVALIALGALAVVVAAALGPAAVARHKPKTGDERAGVSRADLVGVNFVENCRFAEGASPRSRLCRLGSAPDLRPTVEMSAPVLGRIGGTRPGVWLIGNLISPFQRWVIRTSGGRVTLTGKPVLLLTAIGRRSGQPRTLPLMYLRDDGNLIVCNVRPPWERRNPWPLNVRANPEVTIRIRGVPEERIARDARPDEIERLWPRLVELWPPYERFFARTHERAIFVLEVPASK